MKTPIPHDIPLPLPAAEWLLKTLLVVSFVAHILFVNLMVGGSILTLIYEIKGRANKTYDDLAYFIAQTITVNKSLAVVLGVAPLLLINVLYTVWFYAANALTGSVWILVIPLVTVAFLLTYLHKYSWHKMQDNKFIHISIIACVVAIFLFIPLIFLTNINLMLFPDRWGQVKGFISALTLPNVFPRYFHFLAASLAATGLFLVWMIKSNRWISKESPLWQHRFLLTKQFYSISFVTSALQFIIGPLVLFTLPTQGLSLKMLLALCTGVIFAIPALWLMWKELQSSSEKLGQHLTNIAVLLFLTVLLMATGRHFYRDQALAAHKKAVMEKTDEYQELVRAAQNEKKSEAAILEKSGDTLLKGKDLFATCAACHGLENRLVGPPIKEIQKIYTNNPDGIVQWSKNPGKKRADYPQMPPMPLPDSDLKAIADYILSLK